MEIARFPSTAFSSGADTIVSDFFFLAISPKRERPGRLLLLLATSFAMLRFGRNVPFFSLVATPLLAEHLWEWVKEQTWASRLTASTETNAAKPSIPQIAMNSLIVIVALSLCGLAARQATK